MHLHSIRNTAGLAVMAGFLALIIFDESAVGEVIYYVTGLFVLWALFCKPELRRDVRQPASIAAFVMIVYMCLTVVWGQGPPELGNYFLRGLGLILFWTAIVVACRVPDRDLLRLANTLLVVTFIGIIYALVPYLLAGDFSDRNRGPGILLNAARGPSIILACGATGLMLRQHLNRANGWLFVAFIVCVALYIFSTRSRGPMLSMLVWLVALALFDRQHGRRNLAILGGVVLCTALFFAVFPEYLEALIGRSSTVRVRLVAWQHTFFMFWEHPFFGYGLNFVYVQAPVQKFLIPIMGYPIYHPHNLAISTVLYTGFVGLFLLALTTATGLLRLYQGDKRTAIYALPVVALLFALTSTDTSRVITSPSTMWFIFWLPTAFIAGLALRASLGYAEVDSKLSCRNRTVGRFRS